MKKSLIASCLCNGVKFRTNGKLKTMRNIFVGTKSDFYKINDKLPKFKRFAN